MKEPYLVYEFRRTADGIDIKTEMKITGMDVLMAISFLVKDLYNNTPEYLRPEFRKMLTVMLSAPDSPCFDASMPEGSIVVDKTGLQKQLREEMGTRE